ncbi:MAG: hypothetical protein ACXW2P_05890 [Thermoanaerobaculia bacterium]
MSSAVPALYEPLIARDLEAIAPAVQAFRADATSEELFLAVARFAVLSYAPSQHAKHAVIAALSAWELRGEAGERWDDLLTECAYYAAASRQPWSEPPILSPPDFDESAPAGIDELRAACDEQDRLRAERWLARRLDDATLASDLLTVAAEDPSDLGHKLIVTNAALKLVPILGDQGKYVALRTAVWEMTAYRGETRGPRTEDVNRLIERCIAEDGSLESAHAVFHLDAALERGHPSDAPRAAIAPPVYRLGRDLGAALKAHAVAKRFRVRFPNADIDGFVAAVHHNLEHGPSLEEWSFA